MEVHTLVTSKFNKLYWKKNYVILINCGLK